MVLEARQSWATVFALTRALLFSASGSPSVAVFPLLLASFGWHLYSFWGGLHLGRAGRVVTRTPILVYGGLPLFWEQLRWSLLAGPLRRRDKG